jgi:uncharacterized protein
MPHFAKDRHMNKPFAAALFLLAAIAPAAAQTAPASSAASATVLHLSETAEREVPRDRLRVVLAVEATNRDAAKLQAEINRRMSAALARAKTAPDVEAETEGYSVYQEHNPKTPPLWHGSQSLSLRGKDFGHLLGLVGALQQQGLIVTGLAPELSSEGRKAVEDALTDTALARLRQRAAHIAAGFGAKIVAYRDLRIGNAGVPVVPFYAMAAAAAAPARSAPAAEPGTATVSVTVSAEIALTP